MKHIYQRGRVWYYQFTVNGTRYQGKIGEVSESDAHSIAEEKRLKAVRGEVIQRPIQTPRFGRYDAETGQFTDAAGEFVKFCQAHQAPKTIERTMSTMREACAVFAAKRLDDITVAKVEKWQEQRKEGGLADATVNRELAVLGRMFTFAIRRELATTNPVKAVEKFKVDNGRIRWLTRQEEAELLAECHPKLRAFCIVALDTGLRAGELQALVWDEHIKFGEGVITMRRLKNKKPWSFAMTQRVRETLQAWHKESHATPERYVFGSYCYRKTFERARDKAGLGKDVVFHTLRHTFISRLVMLGLNMRVVQEAAGHKRLTMTERYSHLCPEAKKHAAQLLDADLGSAKKVTTEVTTLDPVATFEYAASRSPLK